MLIFWRLLLGHLLADFTFQFNSINAWKRRSIWGMLLHVAMHPILYVALTYPYLGQSWVHLGSLGVPTPTGVARTSIGIPGWACILIITLLHFAEDQWRVALVRKHRKKDTTIYFLWDQIIHWICLFAFVPIGLFDASQGWFPEKWTPILCLVIAATSFCGILIYFIEKDFYDSTFPEFDEKYMAMAERLVIVCCLLFPGTGWWLVLATAWIGVMAYLRRRHIVDFTWFSFFFGGGFAVVSGLAARFIWYAG